MPTSRRVVLPLLCLMASLLAVPLSSPSSAADADVPGTRPFAARAGLAAADEPAADGLQMLVNERGHISQSTSALGTLADEGLLVVDKPAGATVRGAWMAYATRGFSGYQVQAPLLLEDEQVPVTNELLNGIQSYNYFAEVTSIVKPVVDAADTGEVRLRLAEQDTYYVEGEVLVVVFDDPAVDHDQSVTLLYGALAPGGDNYHVALAEPVDLSDPQTRLEMSLGITFSYQTNGTQQYSTVDVNGQPLTTAAGGEDDGQPANGALITAGGLGDSVANPDDPLAPPTHPRSDDELYNLRPFVTNGDKRIEVRTTNPSYDDNVMLATFTMNPPVTEITSDDERTVMLSFGDSYQSGEGAGSAYDDAATYYQFAYENGENYPQAIGGQEDTLTKEATVVGNGCHRALRSYPKLVASYLTDDTEVTLVDRTCSGAKIEPGEKAPIIGSIDDPALAEYGVVDPGSQVAQAVDRLAQEGLTPEDVDVITVGMGGNDAKFSDLVTACLIPTMARELLSRYPNTPGSINWVADRVNCWLLDKLKFHVDDAIEQLAAKERFAQTKLREVFPRADIVQLDYPGILPDSDDAPAWCGGIGPGDIDHADGQAAKIRDIIRDKVAQAQEDSAALDTRYELVEVAGAFGDNALCPADASEALANGISQENFDAEIDRLLSEPAIRTPLDGASRTYSDYWRCVSHLFIGCNPSDALDRFSTNVQALMTAIEEEQGTILPNITKPASSGESVGARFDRSRGLFHPNSEGIAVLACYVHTTLAFLNPYFCPNGGSEEEGRSARSSAAAPASSPVDWRVPVAVAGAGGTVDLDYAGFAPGSSVLISLSGRTLETAEADGDGRVSGSLTLPAAGAGVQVLSLRGDGAAGNQLGYDLRLRYPGRPVGGDDYSAYVTGFESRPDHVAASWTAEPLEVSYAGRVLWTSRADRNGGLLVQVPVPYAVPAGQSLQIQVRGTRSGVVRTVVLDAVPYAPAVWSSAGQVFLSGADAKVDGLVHGETDVRVEGAGSKLTGGVEYTGRLVVTGTGVTTSPSRQVLVGSAFRRVPVADYRPGGTEAVAAGSAYREVPLSACSAGVWTPTSTELKGVVHVPCSVSISASNLDRTVTLAADGNIVVLGSRATLRPSSRTGAVLVAGGDVTVSGSSAQLWGSVHATGTVRLSGSDLTSRCGVTGDSVLVSGARFTASVGPQCYPA